ncbi:MULTISPECIES: hypothetical protein [Streptomyces]|uniref:Uncharacterized protein n=2 Tax=Streptomyces TaxID=1883 RepID=A0ABV9IZP0_9ACTN
MAIVAGVEDTGAIPVLRVEEFNRGAPLLDLDEDVPHGGALPDLYGLEADMAIEQAIERGVLRWSVNLTTGETMLTRSIRNSNT